MNNPNFQNMMAAQRGGNIQQNLVTHYRGQQQKIPQGWQQSVQPEERAQLAFQFFTSFRLLKPEATEQDAARTAVSQETNTFMNSQTKDQYAAAIKSKLMSMTNLRQQRVQGIQNNLNNGMNPAQMATMMGQQGVQGQRPNPQQQFPQGFPNAQLGRPMQASSIPMTQSTSQMGMMGATMNFPQGQNTPQPNMQQQQQPPPPQQQQQQPQPQQQPQQQGQQPDNAAIMQVTRRLMQQARPEVMAKFRQDVEAWPAERRQQLAAQGIDPLLVRFRQQAELMLRSGKISMNQFQGQQAGNQNAAAMQQQQSQMQNQQMMNQRPPNQDFDFNALANQQIEAINVQNQGQQVVPASNNPNANQVMGFPGQNQQQAQPQNAALAQRQAQVAAFQNASIQRQAQQAQVQAQAQAQAQTRVQQQLQQQQQQQLQAQRAAQAQAAQQNNQMLQGQVGGLNLPPNPQQSPAMPMLTRPMVPPGQPNPATPQQRPQAHVPQMTPQGQPQVDPQVATQLMREAQQRAAAAAQGQPLTEQVRMSLMPAEMDPAIKAQLLKVPEHQFRSLLSNYLSNLRTRGQNGMQNPQFQGGQPTPGQPNSMMMNQAQAQAIQMGLQGQMMNGANMANMARTPGIPMGQPAPNGMVGQQMQMGQRPQIPQQQRLANAQHLLQQNPGIIKATDNRAFPPTVLTAPIRQNLPGEVQTWAQLKQWASQNPALMQNIDAHKLLLLQVLHFQDYYLRQTQQGGITGGPRPPQQNPAGIMVPQAQMTPNQGQMPVPTPQPQPNMAAMGPIQVTPQEIATFRQRLPPNQVNTPDETLRNYLMGQKMNIRRQQQQQAMLQQRNQQQQPQLPQQHQQVQQPPMTPQVQPPMRAQPPPTPQPTQPPQQPPPQAQATPQPKPAAKPQQAPKPAQPAQNNMNKGVKRPNEDSNDQGADASAAKAAPQAPPMAPSMSRQGVANMTPEQINKLPPDQQARMRAQLLKAQQDASNNKAQQRPAMTHSEMLTKSGTPEMQAKFRAMVVEEEQKMQRPQPVQISPEVRAQLQQLVREKMPMLRKIEHCLRIFVACFDSPQSEAVARDIIRARAVLLKNINPQDGLLMEQLTLNEDQFKSNVKSIIAFVTKVLSRFSSQASGNAAQQGQQQAPTSDAQSQPGRQQQLNAANLKLLEQQRQSKAPQAPTTDRPPFPLGGQSPRGAPTYFETAPKLTTLTLPPEKKKQKMDPSSQTSTPGQKASPRVGTGKGGSPEIKRQAPPEKPVEQKPTFKCKSADCDYAIRGFDTPAELEAHIKDAHAKIDDPNQFALDAMAELLNLDVKTGQSKKAPAAKMAKPAAVAPKAIKTGQTPGLAQNVTTPAGQQAATPMARVPTQPGIKGSPSTSLLKTPQTGAKGATPAKATPSSVSKPATKATETAAVPEPELEDDIPPFAPLSLFDCSYEDVLGALDYNGPFTVLDLKDEDTSWVLRENSPMNTPDSTSKDTPSTRQSDISENDNLQINIDVKATDVPDAWIAAVNGDPLPLDAQLSDDLQTLGVTLPPMDNSDMMLFYGDNYMMDLDAMDTKMMEGLGTLDPSLLGTA